MPIRQHGKNLFVWDSSETNTYYELTDVAERGKSYLTINGVSTNTVTESDTKGTTFKLGAGDYTITVNGLTVNSASLDRMVIKDKVTGVNLVTNIFNNVPKTFTFTEPHTCALDLVYAAGTVYNNQRITIMIEAGSTATTYEPYVEPKIKHIEAPTKNLFKWDSGKTGTYQGLTCIVEKDKSYLIMDGVSTNTSTASNTKGTEFKLGAGDYTITVNGLTVNSASLDRMVIKDKVTGVNLVTNIFNNVPKTFTFTEPHTCALDLVYAAGTVYNNQRITIMIEAGSTATQYEPYTNIDHFLPSDYQEVEYIESTGTQYIDTGVIPTISTGARIKAQPASAGSIFGIIGSRTAIGAGNRFGLFAPSATGDNVQAEMGDRGYIDTPQTWDVRDLHEYILNKNGFVVDGNVIENFVGTAISESTYPMTIFKCRTGSSTTGNIGGKIYYAKIYDSNVLVRNFIPCYRKSDNEVGLYDTVNNQFYTNQGTGTFIAGPNIVSDKIERAYATDNAGVPSLVFVDADLEEDI